jgi:peptidoglycan/LPS O-acetylase OafA/YrhL
MRTLPAAVVVALLVASVVRPSPADLLSTLTFTAFMARDNTGHFVPHYWSLAVEEWAYLLLPALLLAIRRREPLPWLIGAWVGLLVWREVALATLPFGGGGLAWFFATSIRLDAILSGVIAAALAPRLTRPCQVVLAVIGGAAGVGVTLGAALQPSMWILQASVVPALFALTLPALAGWGGQPARAAGAAVRHIAAVSYGLYLAHWPIYLAARATLTDVPPLAVLAAAVALSWVAALLLRHSVELPCLALRDRLEPLRPRTVLAAD